MKTRTGYLILLGEDGLEQDRWEVADTPVIVGRERQAQVRLADKKASRQHCVVFRVKNGDFKIEDLFSTNGTWLNGQPITGKANLRPYDRIRCGNTDFLFKAK